MGSRRHPDLRHKCVHVVLVRQHRAPSAKGNSRFQMPGDDAWRSAMLEIIRNVNKIH